jgi:hypothetical protein
MLRNILLFLIAATSVVAQPSGPGASAPFLFSSGKTVFMSWLEPVANTDRVALRFARLENGKWSAPRTIEERTDFFVNWADFPSLVTDRDGVMYAHWLQKSGKDKYAYDVRMAISGDGGKTWRPSFLLNRDGKPSEHGFVSMLPRSAGGVGVAWLDGRNMGGGHDEHGEMSVRFATVDAMGSIKSDVELDARACECCATGMTIIGDRPTIVYRDRSADETRDISIASPGSKPRLVHSDGWKINGCPVNGPQIDSLGKSAAVAWFTAANEQARVQVAFSSDSGTTFGKPVRVDDGKPLGRVDLVMMDPKTALVTWVEQTAGGAEIRARLVRADGADPSRKIADSAVARAAGFPRIARTGRDVWFAWTGAGKGGVQVKRVTF